MRWPRTSPRPIPDKFITENPDVTLSQYTSDTTTDNRIADKACLDLRPQSSVVRDGEGREKQCERNATLNMSLS